MKKGAWKRCGTTNRSEEWSSSIFGAAFLKKGAWKPEFLQGLPTDLLEAKIGSIFWALFLKKSAFNKD
ncbi:MAG: hypothetical protein HY518_05925 [Candidatus Aenigmarchaeota archaeon]|nr:hypothetical protein [Candidatus Aenigmarchaeota archaeon]